MNVNHLLVCSRPEFASFHQCWLTLFHLSTCMLSVVIKLLAKCLSVDYVWYGHTTCSHFAEARIPVHAYPQSHIHTHITALLKCQAVNNWEDDASYSETSSCLLRSALQMNSLYTLTQGKYARTCSPTQVTHTSNILV